MKKIIFLLIVFISMNNFIKAQSMYSDSVKNVLGVNLLPFITLIDQQSGGDDPELSIMFKHFLPKGALRFGAYIGGENDYRNDSDYVITINDSLLSSHTITGYSQYVGIRLGYERSKQIKQNFYFTYGIDLMASYNHTEMTDKIYNLTQETSSVWEKSDYTYNTLNSYSYCRIGISPIIGFNYKFSKRFSITAMINFDSYTEFSIDGNNNSSSSFSIMPKLNLMLNYHF